MGTERISTAGATALLQEGKAGAWHLSVEVGPDVIPATAPIDIEGFLAGDADPCQVVAKVPVGWSSNGYFFSEKAVRDIADKISREGATAGLGHIEPGAVGYEFPPVAVAWVGALYDEAARAAFVRGYVDPAMPDLKRHIRSQVINRVSTDGYAKMESGEDGRQVLTSFDLVSLDLAPRLRNGTESPIVARDMKGKEVEDGLSEDCNGKEAPDAKAAQVMELLGANPLDRVRDLLELEEGVKAGRQQEALSKVVDQLVEGEDARPLVMKLAALGGPADEEALTARVKDVLADPAVRRVLDARFTTASPAAVTRPAATDGLLVKLNYQ